MGRKTAVAVTPMLKCDVCGKPVRLTGYRDDLTTTCRECHENAERREARKGGQKGKIVRTGFECVT